jgi:hypothetical protein
MSKKTIGLVLCLVVSLGIGWVIGQRCNAIFTKTVPTGCVSDALLITAHGAYIGLGLLFGVVIFAWAVLVAWLARFFMTTAASTPSTPSK